MSCRRRCVSRGVAPRHGCVGCMRSVVEVRRGGSRGDERRAVVLRPSSRDCHIRFRPVIDASRHEFSNQGAGSRYPRRSAPSTVDSARRRDRYEQHRLGRVLVRTRVRSGSPTGTKGCWRSPSARRDGGRTGRRVVQRRGAATRITGRLPNRSDGLEGRSEPSNEQRRRLQTVRGRRFEARLEHNRARDAPPAVLTDPRNTRSHQAGDAARATSRCLSHRAMRFQLAPVRSANLRSPLGWSPLLQ